MPNLCSVNFFVIREDFSPAADSVETVDVNSETFRRLVRADLRISGADDGGAMEVIIPGRAFQLPATFI